MSGLICYNLLKRWAFSWIYFSQIHETIETINQLKTQREFMLSFARDPQGFINDWLQSQCRDLKVSLSAVSSGRIFILGAHHTLLFLSFLERNSSFYSHFTLLKFESLILSAEQMNNVWGKATFYINVHFKKKQCLRV